MNLLVTGGAGFIGSTFVRQRLAEGQRVVVLDALTYAGHRENLEGIREKGELVFIHGNICDAALVAQLLRKYDIDGLLHFAAESHVDRSITGPAAFIETNVNGTYTLLQASLDYWRERKGTARGSRFRYLQVSTDEVYGSLGPHGKFSETTPFAPNSPYSSSKAAADLLVRAWHHTFGLPTVTTHCSNNYGQRQFPEKLIPHMIECALADKPLPVYGDGGNIRDWIHVEDHSSGVWLAFTRGSSGETYDFGGDSERRNLEVVRAICAELDRLRPRTDGRSYAEQIRFVEDRLGHDRRYAIDDSKAQRELGFNRIFGTFEEGLRETIGWYLSNRSWVESVMRKQNQEKRAVK